MSRMRDLIYIKKSVLEDIYRECTKAAEEGLETGGFLAGTIKGGVKTIEYAIGPGPNAVRTPTQFEPDYGYAAMELKKKDTRQDIKILGAMHLHNLSGLSSGDEMTLKKLCKDFPGFLAMVVRRLKSNFDVRLYTAENDEIKKCSWKKIDDGEAVMDFSRTEGLLAASALREEVVLIVGLGSGGSVVAVYLARTGIGKAILVDNETLERVNLVRHIGGQNQLGMPKVDIAAEQMLAINPSIDVQKENLKLTAETSHIVEKLVEESTLVLACSGHPLTNQLLNKICIEKRKPVIFAGVFARAAGGFVLRYDPSGDAACFGCLYDYTRIVQPESNEELHAIAHRYGIAEDQLSAHQGLFIDISFIALLQAKIGLLTLLEGKDHRLGRSPGNFVLWNNRDMTSTWTFIKKRSDCAACNPEGWLKTKMLNII